MERNCLHCGGLFIASIDRKTFCSRECHKRYGSRKASVCTQCGKSFIPKALDRTKYCSRECAYDHKSRLAEYKKTIGFLWVRRCSQCGNTHFTKRKSSKPYFCDSNCRYRNYIESDKYKARLATVRQNYRNRRGIVMDERACDWCGSLYAPNHGLRMNFCTTQCSDRAARQRHKLRRRTGEMESIEVFSPEEIYRRDGYICQLCGEPTDPAAHYLDCSYPTLDHIIPLSKDGAHVRANVQCVHRFCNSLKSDKALPRMFFAINSMEGEVRNHGRASN